MTYSSSRREKCVHLLELVEFLSFQRLVMMKEVAVIAELVGATRNEASEEICIGTI
jgi:hypothetical protein